MKKSAKAIKNHCVLVLAGGLGVRMKSETPKVLHKICENSLISYPLKVADFTKPKAICVVVGNKRDVVKAHIDENVSAWKIKAKVMTTVQKKLIGSGRAVQEAKPFIGKYEHVIILCGDAPLISKETLSKLLKTHGQKKADCVILTADVPNPKGYGRIFKNRNGQVLEIIEEINTDDKTSKIREINSGTYVFKVKSLLKVIDKIKLDKVKKEIFLTDAIKLMNSNNMKVFSHKTNDYRETLGINNRIQMAEARQIMNSKILEKHMLNGVTIIDPNNTYISPDVKIGKDTVIHPGALIYGKTEIGENCIISAHSYLKDCKISSNAEIKFASFITNSTVGKNCSVGPFAHIRPDTVLEEGSKVGNFTEVKASRIGKGSKVPHLSYVGDTVMGRRVNVGAGAITCNYDGAKKHKTIIGDDCFVGSNVNLVAPIKIGKKVKIGAGSTITDDVSDNSLAIARARQISKKK
jgi:bifunctional UDP-N-acetylglucosamine pyrophosphorylase / glucosamine-1-phosphate N-acetyltransferase